MTSMSALQKQAYRLAKSAHQTAHPASALARIVGALVKDASEAQTRAIREAIDRVRPLTPRSPASELSRKVQATLMGVPMLSSEEVSMRLGSRAGNPRQYAMELRNRGELLGVKRGNRYLYPEFQFDGARQAVYEVVKEVLRLLDAGEDPWGVLSWWVSPNARIPGNRAPKDLLPDASQHGVVRELAESVGEDSG